MKLKVRVVEDPINSISKDGNSIRINLEDGEGKENRCVASYILILVSLEREPFDILGS